MKISQLAISAVLFTTLVACGNQENEIKTSQNSASAIQQESNLTVAQIYQDKTFKSDYIGRIRWLADGSGYTAIEDSALKVIDKDGNLTSYGKDIVVYNPETLERKILITAQQLTPKENEQPLKIDDYIWSSDRQKLLIYTNSKKVWRSNSRGDYWLLDLSNSSLTQLGGNDVNPSSLMFAKFSPDDENVAYVFDNNIYLESIKDQKITQLTNTAGNGIINGLFDWVYEEEFQIRDGFRWSPDGKNIDQWMFETFGTNA